MVAGDIKTTELSSCSDDLISSTINLFGEALVRKMAVAKSASLQEKLLYLRHLDARRYVFGVSLSAGGLPGMVIERIGQGKMATACGKKIPDDSSTRHEP
jgi:hypothetical protein